MKKKKRRKDKLASSFASLTPISLFFRFSPSSLVKKNLGGAAPSAPQPLPPEGGYENGDAEQQQQHQDHLQQNRSRPSSTADDFVIINADDALRRQARARGRPPAP